MGQVDLQRMPARGWEPKGQRPLVITRALPLFRRAEPGCYIHRIRSALVYLHDSPIWRKPGHVAYSFWCGSGGYGDKGHPTDEPAPHEVLCATCEGRAVGAGLPPIGLAMVKPVKFSPRG